MSVLLAVIALALALAVALALALALAAAAHHGLSLAGHPSLYGTVVSTLVVCLGHGAGLHGALYRGRLSASLLAEELELSLLGYKAGVSETLDSLESSSVCLLRYNATLLSLHEISLSESTTCAGGGSVVYLRLCAYV